MVEGTGLENRHAETYRGFESHPLRQEKAPTDRKISRSLLVKERWDYLKRVSAPNKPLA